MALLDELQNQLLLLETEWETATKDRRVQIAKEIKSVRSGIRKEWAKSRNPA